MHEKVAVITGATSGIGRASASLFASRGFSVAAVGRNENELDTFNAEKSGFIRGYKADVTSVDDVDRVVSEILVDHQRVDVLVNAAGIIRNGSIESTSLADWDEMLDINLRSVFYLMQKFIPHLQERAETSSMYRA